MLDTMTLSAQKRKSCKLYSMCDLEKYFAGKLPDLNELGASRVAGLPWSERLMLLAAQKTTIEPK